MFRQIRSLSFGLLPFLLSHVLSSLNLVLASLGKPFNRESFYASFATLLLASVFLSLKRPQFIQPSITSVTSYHRETEA